MNEWKKEGVSFVVYKKPYADHFHILLGTRAPLPAFSSFNELSGRKGFVLFPYDENEGQKRLFLEPIRQFDFPLFSLPGDLGQKYFQVTDNQIDKQKYYKQIATYKSAFDGAFKKAILSRKIFFRVEALNTGVYFLKLAHSYPHAFVYYFSSPYAGNWIGATPENFLSAHSGKMQMMSLAGTSVDGQWTAKEIAEQAFVSEYLEGILDQFQIAAWEKSKTSNLKAGNIFHLLTNYSFPVEDLQHRLADFIEALHPTPAVCGLPKQEAKRLIGKVEKHSREYYTGFLGPWNGYADFDFFVNLRCAKIEDDRMSVFVGGGITKDSIAEREWDETEQKAATLLHVLGN